jgi:pectinesterase
MDEGAATATGAFATAMAGLTASQAYFVRAYATNNSGTSYGTEVSFTTLAPISPTLTTQAVTGITNTTAAYAGSGCGGGKVNFTTIGSTGSIDGISTHKILDTGT